MSNRGKTFPPEVLDRDEILAILDACGNTFVGVRNRALITVLWRCGLRVREALQLRPKDIDRKAGAVRVLHGKGDKSRTVGIDPQTLELVDRWLDTRDRLKKLTSESTLFCTSRATPLDTSYVRRILPILARKAKVWKRVHAHGFRHTHAYELMMEGVPVPIIQRQLGHSSLNTTSRYLDHIAPSQVLDAIKTRTW